MIPIYICDDNALMLQNIEQQIKKILMVEDLDFNIKSTVKNPHQLLLMLEKQPQQGIYFLDVELSDSILNGFDLGKRIREIDPRGFIIYITSFAELLPETFKYRLEALDYIIKDDVEEMEPKIKAALIEIKKRLQIKQPQNDVFTVETGSRILHIPLENIQYFETATKKNVIHLVTKEEIIQFYGTLNDVEKSLENKFFRTHQSFLVNLAYINLIDKKKKVIQLSDGSTCLIARGKIKLLQEKLNLK